MRCICNLHHQSTLSLLEDRCVGHLRRLKLLVVAAIVGFAHFAWQTDTQEQALQDAAVKQDKILTNLADGMSHKAEIIQKVIRTAGDTTKDLTTQLGSLSGDLQRFQNQMEMIQSRLSRVQSAVRSQRVRSLPPQVVKQHVAAPV